MAGSGSGSRTSVRCCYHVEDLQMLRGRPRKLDTSINSRFDAETGYGA